MLNYFGNRRTCHENGSSKFVHFNLLLRLLPVLVMLLLTGSRIAQAQSTLVASPNDGALVNEFIPQGTCGWHITTPCTYQIIDAKTGWQSSIIGAFKKSLFSNYFDPTLPVASTDPLVCYYFFTCTFQPDQITLNSTANIPLGPLGVSDLSNGITFLLRIFTVPRSSNTQTGDLLTMNGVFAIKTIGPRWGLHVNQEISDVGTSGGYDLTPWEPGINNQNLYEDVYYTFTSDGRVRIDKFTPYGANGIQYIWEASINDGGWPSSWANSKQTLLGMQQLALGGLNGNPSTPDGFRSLLVFNKALQPNDMIDQENFYHDSGGNLTHGQVPCNTGQWMNVGAVGTPCGNTGNRTPLPIIPNGAIGLSLATDSYAPVGFTATDTAGQFNPSLVLSSAKTPPLSSLGTTPPWEPFYPVTSESTHLYMIVQDVYGTNACSIASTGNITAFPSGNVLQAAQGFDYPLTSLTGPNTIATTAWLNPNPQGYVAPAPMQVPPGWTCFQINTNGSGASAAPITYPQCDPGIQCVVSNPSGQNPFQIQPTPPKPANRVAYFDSWAVYANNYYIKNLDTQGIAANLTTLIYSFENIDPVNLTCFANIHAAGTNPNDPNNYDGASDAWADYQLPFTSANSVDGSTDQYGQALEGNFNQLRELKKKYPNLRILLSIGGWTYSKFFSDVAATDASRKKFVNSCINLYIDGNLPVLAGSPAGGTGAATGIFDGFDIDWEYPASPNGNVGNHYGPQDTANYTALLAEFRSELNGLGRENYTLSAAVAAGPSDIKNYQISQMPKYLDFADIMTYDFHGGFETNGPTNFQAPLFDASNSPAYGTGFDIADAVNNWIEGGYPPSQLNLGVAFYGRGWTGVPAGDQNDGLYQPATGPSPAFPISQEAGVADYKELETAQETTPGKLFFDYSTDSAWAYDGSNFYGLEIPYSMQFKLNYIQQNGLGGIMMYSLENDDAQGSLFNAAIGNTH